jgi:hypothetical protein
MNHLQIGMDVVNLRKSVIRLIGHLNNLMSQISDFMGAEDEIGKQAKNYQDEFNISRNKLENTQLIMAIVAPLKAGKTTIINTIIGHNLLPTRDAEMTALPTKVILTAKESEPRMLLSKPVIEKFKHCIQTIEEYIKTMDEDLNFKQEFDNVKGSLSNEIQNKLRNPQSDQNLALILDSNKEKEEVTGRENILNMLTDLNDLIRMYNKTCEAINKYNKRYGQDIYKYEDAYDFSEMPSVYTPFFNKEIKQKIDSGNLVIIDTPGIDERGQHNFETVVKREIYHSSIVLLVMDYSALNNKTVDQIREEVQGFIELRGSEHVYILVNKWDHSKRTIEEVQNQLIKEYNINNAIEDNRVFPVIAKYAFAAVNFDQAPQDTSNPEFQEKAKVILNELHPIDDSDSIEEKLKNTDLKQLQNESKKLWKKSLFKNFLENAIASLIQDGVPLSMLSELKYIDNCLLAFEQTIKTKRKFYEDSLNDFQTKGNKLKAKIKSIMQLEKDFKNEKEKFLKNIKETYNILEITDCIKELESKVNQMEGGKFSFFQLQPDNFPEYQNIILDFERNEMLLGISACNLDELYKCLLCKLHDKKIKSFEFTQETDANENNEKIKFVIYDMLLDLITVINTIINNKLTQQDTKFRDDLTAMEKKYLKDATQLVYADKDIQEIFYTIPKLEAYKDNRENQVKGLDIINIQSTKFNLLKRLQNWFERHILFKDIPELIDSHKIEMKKYLIEIYNIMIKELEGWNEKINNDLRNIYYGECQQRLQMVNDQLQKLKSNMENAQKEENPAKVLEDLDKLNSFLEESKIERMKIEIKKHKEYAEQALSSRTAR